MYGGSSKFGRGGGGAARGGGGKRPHSSFPPPPHRSSGPSGGRLSLGGSSGGSRHRPAAGASSGPQSVEETFSLIPGKNPLAFAMIIRLTPDLVDEIRRVESLGETPRIKFDANANNTSGNVIDVGGKEFRFKWSREDADLCDIYEERQSGEDGNGLLVEYGSAWRKLNVQRDLDESTSAHVKMRSEEAEREHKSRKAILVDHGNPSMKSQIKQLAAVETSPWKMFKQKKEPPFKKQKVEPPQGGLPKPAYKSGLASTTVAKSKRPASPLPSPPEQVGASVSPFGTLKTAKGHVNLEDIMPSQVIDKETAASSEKEIQTKAAGVARETPVRRGNFGAKPKDLQSLLITLLTENPKGMSLKALEKAVGDTMPKSAKKIEPIIKRIATFQAPGRFILKQGIATFQAPGRYILKQGVDFESYKKPSSDNGSSPEDNRHQTPAPDNNSKTALEDRSEQTPARESSFDGKIPTGGFEEQTQLNKVGDDINSSEKIDILQLSPNLASERRGSDNSDKQGGSSSSGSDSDSESDSSDSGSDSGSHSKSRSRSRSKSKSPVGSGSGSSSDSDSDASSNSKQGSDEDVDIMTSDDDKEPKNKLQASEPRLSILPDPWGATPDGIASQNGLDELKDDQECDVVEIEKDLPRDGREAELPSIPSSVSQRDSEKRVEEAKSISPDRDEPQDRQNIIESLFEDEENVVEDDLKLEQSPSSERISKGKSSKGSDSKHFNEQSEHAKRLKAESLAQPPVVGSKDAQFSRSPRSSSPGRNTELGTQKGYNQAIPVKSSSDFHQSGQRPYDQSGRARGQDAIERSDKHAVILGSGRKQADKNIVHESFSMQKDKAYRDASNEDGYVNERKAPSNSKEESGGKYSGPSDLHYRKHNDMAGKFKEFGQDSNSHIGSSPKNNRIGVNRSPLANGRSSFLQRELSDLELGELREPMPEEPPPKKQFERKSSFKQSENKLNATENWNSDSSRGKYVGKAPFDSGKPSPPNFSSGLRANLDALSRKKTPEQHVEDVTRSYNRVAQSQMQNASRADQAELVSQSNKQTDFSSKSRQNESGAVQGFGIEGSGESHRKAPIIAPQHHDIGRGPAPYQIKENKRPTTNTAVEMTEGHRDVVLAEGNNSERKRKDSYSDEISCSYSKYEKDKPELKGPIKDFSQYKEYVQDYHDKFDSYCSLNKILENYRNEFQKLGKDLELAKDRDMDRYHNIVRQLKESYQQCGEKHKRLKKIFVVLHEELKTLKQRIKDFAYTKD